LNGHSQSWGQVVQSFKQNKIVFSSPAVWPLG
jgi:hypothetical protein